MNEQQGFLRAVPPSDSSIGALVVDPISGAAVAVANDFSVDVSGSSTPVIAANANRRELTVINDSTDVIYLKRGTSAALNSGIRLNASGGSYTTQIYTGPLAAISTGSLSRLLVVES